MDASRRGARDCPRCNGPLLIFDAWRDDHAHDDCQGLCKNCGLVCGAVDPATVIRGLSDLFGNTRLKVGPDAILLFNNRGEMILARLSPAGYEEQQR